MQVEVKNYPPVTGITLAFMTISLALATFMQVLDSSIANVAIPTISGDLGASSSQGTWIITSFGVANAISIPITGWLAKRFGEVKLFLASTALFTFFSWCCGMSSNLEVLIFFRVMQGTVSGPLIPLSQSLLLNNYPPKQRPLALAFWAMTVVIAPVVGPILGGWISDNAAWGWIFFINVPVGIFVVLVSGKILLHRETSTVREPVDLVGLILLVFGVGALQLMLDKGREYDWFSSTEIVILAIIAVVGLIWLVIWELTDDNPIVDVSLFKSWNFSIGCLCTSLSYLFYIGSIVLIPILLQSVYGYTATWAGLATAPVGILPLIVMPIIGKYSSKFDMRALVTFSFLVYATSFMWRAYVFEPDMGFFDVAFPQFIQGLAVACFFMPLTDITLSEVPENKMASATSLFNFSRTLAGSIGTSLVMNMWYNRESLHHERLVESITPYTQNSVEFYHKMEAMGMSQQQTSGFLAKTITQQGFIISSNEIFWLSALAFLSMIVVIWFSKPNKDNAIN